MSLPSRREALQVLGAALAVALICWYLGVDVWHSLLLGCAITVVGLACIAGSSTPEAIALPWRTGSKAGGDGSRNDVASLSRSLRGGWGLVGLTAERQLRQIAGRRLALEGLDLTDPAQQQQIERLIGSPAYRILTRRTPRRLRARTLLSCLNALDGLSSTYYPVPQPRSRGRGWRSTPSTPQAPGRNLER